MDKKGILGLDTAQSVLLVILTLAVLAVAGFFILSTLQTSAEGIMPRISGTAVVNETVSSINEQGNYLSVAGNRNCAATIIAARGNVTGTTFIAGLGNFTTTGCRVYTSSDTLLNYNNSNFNFTYTYTYIDNATNAAVERTVSGAQGFFAYVPTFFILLAVVVLILIIAIVIIAVGRFGSEGTSETLQKI